MELAYILVLLGVIFLYFQLILGRICRWSRNWLVRKGAEASYNLSNMVGTVALGFMPKEHSAAVWILYLTVLNNSMAAYDQENELLYMWTAANIFLFALRAVVAVGRTGLSGAAMYLAYDSVVALVLASACCKVGIARASASKRYSEEIKRYMERLQAKWSPSQYYNASTLDGYRYAVILEPLTTVEQIYAPDSPLEVRRLERGKGLWLSFALFRLLLRRYHGLPCDEADLPETRDLVLEGLLGPHQKAGDEEYRFGFGVAEAELGFLHDHIHGGYVLWSREHRVCYRILVALKAILMYVASLALYCLVASSGPQDRGAHAPDDRFMALLFLHFVLDLLQIIFYYRSDRWMVSYMCQRRTQGPQNCFRRMMARMHGVKLLVCWDWNVYWQDRIGQYSLLEETTRRTACDSIAAFLRQQACWDGHSHSPRQSAPARLPRHLRACIARVLRATNGTLDGVPSLERAHGLPRGEVRRDKNSHKIKVILKWHIATTYCEMGLRRDVGDPRYEVAAALSRYCAYLVAFRPDLLPCPQGHTKATFRRVLDEVAGLLGDHLPMEDRFDTLERRRERDGQVPEKTVTLSDGLDLGHLLVTGIQERHQLWEILQNIWVKLVLSIAPQASLDATFAKRHVKYLAQGGEFLTQLWAMLSHAGILQQTSWPTQVHDQPNQFMTQLIHHYYDTVF
ncbi:unnamed protein product [Urochloa decumbens]|uniref:DUF4220 domain-containing protein n=1 Tax=Urochloa decumbens TaxID=240449 RepID=A0ABC8W6Z5_9POAL